MALRIQTLGGLRVYLDEQEMTSLYARPARCALLVFMTVEGDVSREKAVSRFWSDKAPDKARKALAQALFELRNELGDDWYRNEGDRLVLTENVDVDTHAFEEADAREDFEAATALYHGPFLDGFGSGTYSKYSNFSLWADTTANRLRRAAGSAFQGLIRTARSRSDPEAAIHAARGWVDCDVSNDEAQYELINNLIDGGQRAEALRQFQEYEAICRELDAEPEERIRELIDSISTTPRGSSPSVGHGLVPKSESPRAPPAARRVRFPEIGDVPGLELIRRLGSGETAEVYLARDPGLRRTVAVKVLSDELGSTEEALRRFAREARTLAQIEHPNVAAIHHVGELEDRRPYLVMRYVNGTTIAERLKFHELFEPSEVRRIMERLASALAAAHAVKVIHRDVNPGNALYEEPGGEVFLADFGLARLMDDAESDAEPLTRTGTLLGHPAYRSPEIAQGLKVTDRTDVYSLGVLAFEMRNGGTPTSVTNRKGGSGAVDVEERVPDRQLDALIKQCLHKDPFRRPSAADVARRLEGQADGSLGGPGLIRRALDGIAGWIARVQQTVTAWFGRSSR